MGLSQLIGGSSGLGNILSWFQMKEKTEAGKNGLSYILDNIVSTYDGA